MKKIAVMLLFLMSVSVSGCGCADAWRDHLGDKGKMIERVEVDKDEIRKRLRDEGWRTKRPSGELNRKQRQLNMFYPINQGSILDIFIFLLFNLRLISGKIKDISIARMPNPPQKHLLFASRTF
ncbi:MAG: hypothetical protein PVI90_15110, partial [Desulfobacteraceae bacterium]